MLLSIILCASCVSVFESTARVGIVSEKLIKEQHCKILEKTEYFEKKTCFPQEYYFVIHASNNKKFMCEVNDDEYNLLKIGQEFTCIP